MTYRWDFGDGTEFTPAYESATVGHTYAKPGRYTVRVEATNQFGTTVVVERVVTIGIPAVCARDHAVEATAAAAIGGTRRFAAAVEMALAARRENAPLLRGVFRGGEGGI